MMRSSLSVFCLLLAACALHGQISTSGTGLRTIGPENGSEAKVIQITSDAGIYFNQGLLNLQDSRRSEARIDFDKSLEVFLMSGINVKSNEKLKNCYSQLIETVFRMEFPSSQLPQIKGLSVTCGWNIDGQLADSVAKLTIASTGILNSGANYALMRSELQPVGFSDQKFEPSPLDELLKPNLTPRKRVVANRNQSPPNAAKAQKVPSRPNSAQRGTTAPKTQNLSGTINSSGSSLLLEACEIQLDDLPAVRSLKIGLSRAAISVILPRCGNDLSYNCFYRVEALSGTINRNNLDAIAVNFNEYNTVSSFSIIYDDSIKWKSTREFALSLSDSLGLNPARWQYSTTNKKPNPKSEIYFSCTNYYAKVTFVDEIRPQLTFSKTKALIEAEEERDQQRRKKTFQP